MDGEVGERARDDLADTINTVTYVVENADKIGAKLVEGAVETAKGVAKGDLGAITRFTSFAASVVVPAGGPRALLAQTARTATTVVRATAATGRAVVKTSAAVVRAGKRAAVASARAAKRTAVAGARATRRRRDRVISIDGAIALAQRHLDAKPLPSPEYVWVVPEPTRAVKGWVFEYEYKNKGGLPPEEWECFGGAPAFIVFDDSTIRDLDWGEP